MEKKLLDEFEEDLLADGKAPKTLASYVGDVRYFIDWLENKGVTFNGVLTRMYVTQYKEYLLRKDYSVIPYFYLTNIIYHTSVCD